jgi:hypothetical protein
MKETPQEKKIVYDQIMNVLKEAPRSPVVDTLKNSFTNDHNKLVQLKGIDNSIHIGMVNSNYSKIDLKRIKSSFFFRKAKKGDPCLMDPCLPGFGCVTSTEAEDGFVCVSLNESNIKFFI